MIYNKPNEKRTTDTMSDNELDRHYRNLETKRYAKELKERDPDYIKVMKSGCDLQ